MKQPRYFNEMLPHFPQDIKGRIEEIEKELQDLISLKSSNRLSSEDIEDMSDLWQYHLEWNNTISELNDELECLKYQQLTLK